jgi:hypothetical protein
MYQLGLVKVCDSILGSFAIDECLELAWRSTSMALECTADVDEEGIVVDEFATDDERSGCVHLESEFVAKIVRRSETCSLCEKRTTDLLIRRCVLIMVCRDISRVGLFCNLDL